MPEPRFLGKYRGTVTATDDPWDIGRVRALVPDVLGDTPCTWAYPCFPFAGPQMGQFVLPVTGSGVWIEFEQGDVDHPIWVGCWYGDKAEVPDGALHKEPPNTPNVLLQTRGKRTVILSDDPKVGITLRGPGDAKIVINDDGILISNGKGAEILLDGKAVNVNRGGLEVR